MFNHIGGARLIVNFNLGAAFAVGFGRTSFASLPLRGATSRMQSKAAEARSAEQRHKSYIERNDRYLEDAIKTVGEIELVQPDPLKDPPEVVAAGAYLDPRDASIMDGYAHELGIRNLHDDPMSRARQIRAALLAVGKDEKLCSALETQQGFVAYPGEKKK